MNFGFSFLLTVEYLIVFIAYLLDVKASESHLSRAKRFLLFVALISHLVFIFWLFSKLNYFPLTTKSGLFTFVAFAVAFVYFLLELLTEIYGTGFLIVFFSFLFQALSVIMTKANSNPSRALLNNYISFHVIAVLIGYVAFSISAAYGTMYVVLSSKLKKNRFDAFFNKLPNLEILYNLSSVSFYLGFVLLSLALAIGLLWLPTIFPQTNYGDPKVVLTLTIWLIYFIGAVLKILKIIHGRKFVFFNVLTFVFLVAASVITAFLNHSFHTF